MSTQDPLVAHLRRTGRALGTRANVRDLRAALERIVSTAPAAVPAAHVAGLTLVDDDYVRHAVATSAVGELDALQGERCDGPAATLLLDAPVDGIVLVEDFAGAERDRWPEFASCALEAGYRSMLSVVLEVEGAPRGALNLYGVAPRAFDAHARRVAGLLATTVGMFLLGVEQVAHMERAVADRDVIGRAKDVLRERFGIDEDAAHARLVEASQDANVGVVEVARWLDRESRGRHLPVGTEPCL